MRRYAQGAMDRLYGFCHYMIVVAYDMFFRGEVAGQEHLPPDGPFVIASNHASFLDPPLVGCQVPRQMCFFARKSLWKGGLASWWLDGVGTIPVDREGGGDVSSIKRVLRALGDGRVLIMFPEGTRSMGDSFLPAKPGVGMILCRTRVPVVPARIFGSHLALGRGGPLHLGQPVSIVFGKPMTVDTYDPGPSAGSERYQRASERIMEAVAGLHEPSPAVI